MEEKTKNKFRVLYIDDEKHNLTGFKYMFREYYDIYLANSAAEGYEIMKQHEIPVVISDQRMPVETGVEFFVRIRSEFPGAFRMILTGYSDIEAVIDAINKGHVYYYFKKPWNEEEVRVVINNALEAIDLKNQLREKNQQLRSTFEQAAVGIAHFTPKGRFLLVNDKFCNMLGYTREELSKLTVGEITHPDDMMPGSPEVKSIVSGDKTNLTIEKRYCRKDGSYMWGNLHLSAIRKNTGPVKYMLAIVEDISERKAADQALERSEKKFRDLQELAPDGMVIVNDSHEIIMVNQEVEKLFGYTRDEMIGRPVEMLIPERFVDAHREFGKLFISDKKKRAMGTGLNIYALRKDGSEFPVEVSLGPIHTSDGLIIISTIRDITERKTIEKELKVLNERFSLATQSAKIGVWDWDVKNNILIWDEILYELYGIKKEKFNGAYEAWGKVVHPDDIEKADAEVKAALSGEKKFDTEFRIIWPNGDVRYIRGSAIVLRDDNHKPSRMIGVNWDNTYQRKVEKEIKRINEELEARVKSRTAELEIANLEMQESEEKFRTIAAAAQSAIIMINENGEIQFWNRAAENIFGWTQHEVIGKDAHKLLAPERYHADYKKGYAKFRETGRGPLLGKTVEITGLRKDGTEIFIEAAISSVHLRGKLNAIGIFNDITDRKEAEEELRRNMEDIERFNRLALGREEQIIALKEEINELLVQAGQEKRYSSV